jgi:hypothetical protein
LILDAVATAAQIVSYAYPEDQDPSGAFEWWLSPCGGTNLVPDEIKRGFDILNTIAGGVSSFKPPKNIPKGSGRKGDDANPTDRSKPKPGSGSGVNGQGSSGVKKIRKCNVKPATATRRMGGANNTVRVQSCTKAPNGGSTTTKVDYVVTSLSFGSRPTTVSRVCSSIYSQACYHYSSAIALTPAWNNIKCPHGSVRGETGRPATAAFYRQHHSSWRNPADRAYSKCDADEYPPRYLLVKTSPELINAGKPGGQLMRYLPDKENQGAGKMWKGVCFVPHLPKSNTQFLNAFTGNTPINVGANKQGIRQLQIAMAVDAQPYFAISEFEHAKDPVKNPPPPDAGMWVNPCWPAIKAAGDPGFALWSWDDWYSGQGHSHLYDFTKP